MRILLAVLLALHGAIHAMGFLKAFGLAELPQLRRPIGPRAGVLWLLAALLLLAAAVVLLVAPRAWWAPAALGVVLSQCLIAGAWSDARYGTIANVLILVPLVLTLAEYRPSSLTSIYQATVTRELARTPPPADLVTEADLARVPDAVRVYLRRAGVLGRPHVHNLRATFAAQLRMGPDKPWMRFSVEQYEFFGPPARLFFMRGGRTGIPFVALHRYVGNAATMQVKVAGLLPVVDVGGAHMTQGETVTLLNDMFFLAPATLVDAPIRWEAVDAHTVRATYANAGHTVSALAFFDDAGDLRDFRSEDRFQNDGRTEKLLPWSTPVTTYRDVGGARLAADADARWTESTGEWTYARFSLLSIEYNVRAEED